MQDRGLAAYIAELVGTFFLVFVIGTVVSLYVAAGGAAQFGSDFAVIGLVHGFVLFMLIQVLGGVSGAHLNPAVTAAAAFLKRIDPVDAVVYVLAQLSGGVLGALLVKGLLEDEGSAANYGAAQVSPLLGGDFPGVIVEGIGTFLLVLAVCRGRAQRARLARLGSAVDRPHPRLRRDDLRPAHRRRVQPGPLVRPGARLAASGAASGPTSSARSSARSSPPRSTASSCSRARPRRSRSRTPAGKTVAEGTVEVEKAPGGLDGTPQGAAVLLSGAIASGSVSRCGASPSPAT